MNTIITKPSDNTPRPYTKPYVLLSYVITPLDMRYIDGDINTYTHTILESRYSGSIPDYEIHQEYLQDQQSVIVSVVAWITDSELSWLLLHKKNSSQNTN